MKARSKKKKRCCRGMLDDEEDDDRWLMDDKTLNYLHSENKVV